MHKKIIFLSSLLFFLAVFSDVFGARIYLEPASGEFFPGESFFVDIRIDTQGECINAAQIDIKFSNDLLNIIAFNDGESIFTLWVQPASINQKAGTISFVGGLPGKYCGRLAGDPGPSNLLGRIIFKVPGTKVGNLEENFAEIKFLDTSQVILSDKKGTISDLFFGDAVLKIAKAPGPANDAWQEILKSDKTPPEPFEIVIQQDPLIFENKYFFVFSTTDKQTGIDYFEIKEGDEEWHKAKSPYLLKDQKLESRIAVRAADRAGNLRSTEYMPLEKIQLPLYKNTNYIIIILTISFILLIIIFYKKKSSYAEKKK